MSQDFSWSAENYKKNVEETRNKGLREYIEKEIEFITTGIENPETKTFIDVGAGYGRVLPHLANQARQVINVELDDRLFDELNRRCENYPNSIAVKGNANRLSEVLEGHDITNPVLFSLQNTLGPWEGNRYQAIDEMRRVAESRNGEIIMSIFSREGLKDWGVSMYRNVANMIGEPDLENSDLDNGIYRTKTGYESHWFSKEEREAIKERLGGNVVGEVETPHFHIFHIKYS